MKPLSLNSMYQTDNQEFTTILPTIFDHYTPLIQIIDRIGLENLLGVNVHH